MDSNLVTKTIDRDAAMVAVSRILRSHRCRDWHCEDDESSMQLIDVLSQHSEDGTVTRAMEECDDLACDIVDELFEELAKKIACQWLDGLVMFSLIVLTQRVK